MLYERAGVPHYWIADPAVPSLSALQRGADGAYEQLAMAAGDEVVEVAVRLEARIRPSELVDPATRPARS